MLECEEKNIQDSYMRKQHCKNLLKLMQTNTLILCFIGCNIFIKTNYVKLTENV